MLNTISKYKHMGYKTRMVRKNNTIKDPIWGDISCCKDHFQAFELPTFQRLKNLKQLSAVNMIFRKAVHTRYEHSVGVSHVSTKIFDLLEKKYRANQRIFTEFDKPVFLPAERLALQFAALFHDVGHGPFSHIWDIFCHRIGGKEFIDYTHTNRTWQLIAKGKGKQQDIPNFLTDLSEKLRKNGMEKADLLLPKNIAALAIGASAPSAPSHVFLSQIISSPCDADRMDYLIRDAFYAGIPFVDSSSSRALLEKYCLSFSEEERTWKLALDISGWEIVKSLLEGRNFAYNNIYYHSQHRIVIEMITAALYELLKNHNPEELVRLTDMELIEAFLNEGTLFTRDIGRRIQIGELYQPIELQVFHELSKYELSNTFCREHYSNTYDLLTKLGEKMGLLPHERILVDQISLSENTSSDWNSHIFLDSRTGKMYSLTEILDT